MPFGRSLNEFRADNRLILKLNNILADDLFLIWANMVFKFSNFLFESKLLTESPILVIGREVMGY